MERNARERRRFSRPAGRRAYVLGALIALIVLGAGYYYYYRAATSYMVSRDMRLLSSASLQLDQSLVSSRSLVRNFASAVSWCSDVTVNGDKVPVKEFRRGDSGTAPWLGDFLGDVQWIARGDAVGNASFAADDAALPDEQFHQRIVPVNGRLWLEVEYRDRRAAETPPKHAQCPVAGPRHAVARIPFDNIVQRVFERLSSFDTVLIARGDGSVIYQIPPAERQVRRLTGPGRILPAGRGAKRLSGTPYPSELLITSLGSLRERVGWTRDQPLSMEGVRDVTRRTEVKLAGSTYFLLSQPYPFPAPSTTLIPPAPAPVKVDDVPDNAKDKQKAGPAPVPAVDRWMICGVVGKSRFLSESMAISMSLIALGAALVLLLICAGPFLKLALLGERDPVTRADTILLGLALLFGTSLATLVAIDLVVYKRVGMIADEEQHAYAVDLQRYFRDGIIRAVRLTFYLQAWSLKEAEKHGGADIPNVALDGLKDDKTLTDLPGVADYPWFTSFAWIDRQNRHHFRGRMENGIPPLLDLTDRSYIRTVQTQPWTWRDSRGRAHQFVIDSGRTLTTGRPETIFAVPTELRELPVFAVTMPFVQAVDRVMPPGLQFAIIDADGNVMYHSDESRIGAENLFAETDHDRRLRAAVFSRHEEFVNTRYWGEHVRAHVMPLKEAPWTLVTFRDKRLLRTINFEALVMSLIFLIVYIVGWALLFLFAGFVKRRYRVSWLWPDEERLHDWKRLRWILLCTALAFAMAMFFYVPAIRLMISFVVPVQAALTAYIVLLRATSRRPMHAVVYASWAAITLLLVIGITAGHVERVLLSPRFEWLVRGVIFGLAAAAVVLTLRSLVQRRAAGSWNHYAKTYVACGVLMIVNLAILPTIGFFATAYRMELESLMKYGQLVYAHELQRRVESLAERSWADDVTDRLALSYALPEFFRSTWCLQTPLRHLAAGPCGVTSNAAPVLRPDSAAIWVPAVNRVARAVESLIPRLSDDSTPISNLHHGGALDGSWRWLRSGRAFALIREVSFATGAAQKLGAPPKWSQLVVVSRLPSLLPERIIPDDAVGPYRGAPAQEGEARDSLPKTFRWQWQIIPAAVIAGLLLPLFGLVRFIARRIFAWDIREPSWLGTSFPIRPSLGDHIFLVHGGRKVDEIVGDAGFHVVSFAQLHAEGGWDTKIEKLRLAAGARNVICCDFEWQASDAAVTRQKLVFLERLAQIPGRTIVIASTIRPVFHVRGAENKRRWMAVLERFVLIERIQHTESQKTLGEGSGDTYPPLPVVILSPKLWRAEWPRFVKRLRAAMGFLGFTRGKETNETWLREETRSHPILAEMAAGLPASASGREQLADDLAEAAESYYAALWAPCSPRERLLLYHIARYGFVNTSQRKLLRRLMVRGLVVRNPEIVLTSETFRRFVLSRAVQERMDVAEAQGDSAWARVRHPLLASLVAIAVFFLATQQDLLTATSAVLTGLAAGVPALIKLIGIFTDRRAATSAAD